VPYRCLQEGARGVMGAPADAITLKQDSDPKWWESESLKYQSFVCPCGYKGKAGELLVDPSGDNDTMWCPQCKAAGWIWA